MAEKLTKAKKAMSRELKLLISSYIALKHIHQLVEKAGGDVGKVSDKQAKSEIRSIWRKLRTGIGSPERAEYRIARGYEDLLGEVKKAEVDLTPEEVEKINYFIKASDVFNSILKRDVSRGGEIEKALKKAMDATDRKERIKILRGVDKTLLSDTRTIEYFEFSMKGAIAEIKRINERRRKPLREKLKDLFRRKSEREREQLLLQEALGTESLFRVDTRLFAPMKVFYPSTRSHQIFSVPMRVSSPAMMGAGMSKSIHYRITNRDGYIIISPELEWIQGMGSIPEEWENMLSDLLRPNLNPPLNRRAVAACNKLEKGRKEGKWHVEIRGTLPLSDRDLADKIAKAIKNMDEHIVQFNKLIEEVYDNIIIKHGRYYTGG